MAKSKKKLKKAKAKTQAKAKAKMKAKAKDLSSPAAVWDGVQFTLRHGWNSVGRMFERLDHLPGTCFFKAIPSQGQSIQRLHLMFNQDEMRSEWKNVVFDTFGTVPPTLGRDLPEWQNTKAIADEYETVLGPLVLQMIDPDADLVRIKSRVTPFSRTVIGVYLSGVVEATKGPNTDLIVFTAAALEGGGQPDGGATGPPTRP